MTNDRLEVLPGVSYLSFAICHRSFLVLPLMTAANKITLVRIGLIPGFVWLAWAYGRSSAGANQEKSYVFGAIAIFILAACTDGIDGFVARQFHQESRLGAILDPIADKGLVAAGLGVRACSGGAPR